MDTEIRQMTIGDYESVVALWQSTEGIGLDFEDADSRESVEAYLERNPGLSFVATDGGKVIGAVLCGHDGRRGYLHHLALDGAHRRRGIGKALVARCISGLGSAGIPKCNILVFSDNDQGQAFWEADGWSHHPGLQFLQKPTSGP